MAKYQLDTKLLKSRLSEHKLSAERTLAQKHPHALKHFQTSGLTTAGKIRTHAARLLTAGAVAGAILLGGPVQHHIKQHQTKPSAVAPQTLSQNLSSKLKDILPKQVGKLTPDQEKQVTETIQKIYGVNAVPQLSGNRLNDNYGYIGAEQHLPRYPGDSLDQHDEYLREGITPGLGAWGYFANSRDSLTPSLVNKEKFYVAVQTLYLPDWQQRFSYLRDWYQYRKVIVVNPANGKAVLADIADAGPANWTGKQFGGSPEVMAHLGLNVGPQKGAVVLFFVDDPEDNLTLGPLQYNINNLAFNQK